MKSDKQHQDSEENHSSTIVNRYVLTGRGEIGSPSYIKTKSHRPKTKLLRAASTMKKQVLLDQDTQKEVCADSAGVGEEVLEVLDPTAMKQQVLDEDTKNEALADDDGKVEAALSPCPCKAIALAIGGDVMTEEAQLKDILTPPDPAVASVAASNDCNRESDGPTGHGETIAPILQPAPRCEPHAPGAFSVIPGRGAERVPALDDFNAAIGIENGSDRAAPETEIQAQETDTRLSAMERAAEPEHLLSATLVPHGDDNLSGNLVVEAVPAPKDRRLRNYMIVGCLMVCVLLIVVLPTILLKKENNNFVEVPVEAERLDCGTAILRQTDYRGKMNVSVFGSPCQVRNKHVLFREYLFKF